MTRDVADEDLELGDVALGFRVRWLRAWDEARLRLGLDGGGMVLGLYGAVRRGVHGKADGVGGDARVAWYGISMKVAVALDLGIGRPGADGRYLRP